MARARVSSEIEEDEEEVTVDCLDVPVGKPINHIIEIDREHTVVIVNGKTEPADYIAQENDVIIIRTVPAAISTAALITAIVVGVIAIGAGVYAGVKAYQAREAAKRAEEEIEKIKIGRAHV